MSNYQVSFVIVCRCNSTIEEKREQTAWVNYTQHIKTCPDKTHAWSGWTFREIA